MPPIVLKTIPIYSDLKVDIGKIDEQIIPSIIPTPLPQLNQAPSKATSQVCDIFRNMIKVSIVNAKHEDLLVTFSVQQDSASVIFPEKTIMSDMLSQIKQLKSSAKVDSSSENSYEWTKHYSKYSGNDYMISYIPALLWHICCRAKAKEIATCKSQFPASIWRFRKQFTSLCFTFAKSRNYCQDQPEAY